MRFGILILFFSFFVICSQKGICQNEFLQNTGKRNLHLDKEISGDINSPLNSKINSDLVEKKSNHIDNIVSKYQKDVRQKQLSTSMAKGSLELPRAIINGALILAGPKTGGASMLLVPAVNTYYSKLTDYAIDVVTKTGEESVRRNLKTRLTEYQEKFGEEDYNKLIQTNDLTSFKSQLEDRLGFIFDDTFENIDEKDKSIVLNFYDQEIAKAMKDGFASLGEYQVLQDEEIKENSEKIEAVALNLKGFADNTLNRLTILTENQTKINKGLESLNNRADKTEGDIQFIQEFLFSSMSPKEQLIALEKGFFTGKLSPNEIEKQKQKVILVKQRMELEESFSNFLNSGAEILKIAEDLGLSGEAMEIANDVIKGGQGAHNAYQSLVSVPPNYLGAVSAITGIFAKKRDFGAERHKQVMEMLGKIYTKLGIMDEKLDALLKGQETLLDNQIKIFEAIISLSEQVERNHIEVIRQLQYIQRDILYNRILIREDIEKKYQNCLLIIYSADGETRYIDTQNGIYPSDDQLEILHRNFSEEIRFCWEALTGILAAKKFSAGKFWLESYEEKDSSIKLYIEKIYEPARYLLFDLDETLFSQNKELMKGALFIPVGNIDALNKKKGIEFTEWEDNFPQEFFVSFDELMKIALSPDAIEHHVNLVLDLHYYDIVLDSRNNYYPFPKKYLMEVKNTNYKGRIKLERALSLVNTAIAQQTLLTGDVLLHNLSDIFDAHRESPEDSLIQSNYTKAIALLENNHILAYNFMLFKIRGDVSSFTSYGKALNSKPKNFGASGDYELKKVIDYPWKYYHSDKKDEEKNILEGWSVKLGEKYINLPNANTLPEGQFIYQPDLIMLSKLKERLIAEISTYTIYEGISKDERLMLNELMLSGN